MLQLNNPYFIFPTHLPLHEADYYSSDYTGVNNIKQYLEE